MRCVSVLSFSERRSWSAYATTSPWAQKQPYGGSSRSATIPFAGIRRLTGPRIFWRAAVYWSTSPRCHEKFPSTVQQGFRAKAASASKP
jgi:hypothetical protein